MLDLTLADLHEATASARPLEGPEAGTDQWVAAYSGDGHNSALTGTSSDTSERVVVRAS